MEQPYEEYFASLIRQLNAEEEAVRLKAGDLLTVSGPPSSAEARRAGITVLVRMGAIQTLGQLGDRRAFEALLPLLQEPQRELRLTAAVALGELGDERALDPLLHLLAAADGTLRADGARGLGRLGEQRACAPLYQRLLDEEAPVREAAVGHSLTASMTDP